MGKGQNYILDKAAEMQSKGIYAFSLAEIRESFPGQSNQALALALNRAVNKGRIRSVHKGYYVIIPPEYASQGAPPPPLFIDGLMRYLDRKYYVGLLNAAAYHGAAHQQPQEFTVVTGLPPLRMKQSNSIKIQFVAKKVLPGSGIEQRKTDTGYFGISSAELTAFDLIQFEERVGGLTRVSQVLSELVEAMDEARLQQLLNRHEIAPAYVQRLGYMLEKLEEESPFPELLKTYLEKTNKPLQRVPLRPKGKRAGYLVNPRWKIIENMNIDIG
jgi:predicted transcriptional regulator of viral defense system